ncbi:MAG: Bax inhibitor-1/YccA family protein [Hyphomicrobiales bacterium]|nr:Bax inhibitor-1/YccA family protein [Hyphomicrobiales bacterium]
MSDFDRNSAARWGQSVDRAGSAAIDQGLRTYMIGVYNYMTLGLGVTGLAALAVNQMAFANGALTPFGQMLYLSPLKWVVMLAPLAFILLFSFNAHRMSASAARTAFLVFSAVMGVSLSSILVVFTGASVVRAFFITAAAFAGLSLYGYTTKRDLSPMASFLIMGVIGIIIASLVNVFLLHSSGMQFALSILTVLVFSGLTAWDTQAIKEMYFEGDGYEVATKKSVNGALMLYLDFINIFQSILSLSGDRN